MNWYIRRTDGTGCGPMDFDTLKAWATDGRLQPADRVSQDMKDWQPAPKLTELGMEWIATLANGGTHGPVHLLSLREKIRDGSVTPDSRLTHAQTRETTRFGDALLMHMIERYEAVLAISEAEHARVLELEKQLADTFRPQIVLTTPTGTLEKIAAEMAANNAALEEVREQARQLAERLELAEKEAESARRKLTMQHAPDVA
ncbi:MAG TPA: DUF4339 domain-containing protein [Kiritimatiellia bacterium]